MEKFSEKHLLSKTFSFFLLVGLMICGLSGCSSSKKDFQDYNDLISGYYDAESDKTYVPLMNGEKVIIEDVKEDDEVYLTSDRKTIVGKRDNELFFSSVDQEKTTIGYNCFVVAIRNNGLIYYNYNHELYRYLFKNKTNTLISENVSYEKNHIIASTKSLTVAYVTLDNYIYTVRSTATKPMRITSFTNTCILEHVTDDSRTVIWSTIESISSTRKYCTFFIYDRRTLYTGDRFLATVGKNDNDNVLLCEGSLDELMFFLYSSYHNQIYILRVGKKCVKGLFNNNVASKIIYCNQGRISQCLARKINSIYVSVNYELTSINSGTYITTVLFRVDRDGDIYYNFVIDDFFIANKHIIYFVDGILYSSKLNNYKFEDTVELSSNVISIDHWDYWKNGFCYREKTAIGGENCARLVYYKYDDNYGVKISNYAYPSDNRLFLSFDGKKVLYYHYKSETVTDLYLWDASTEFSTKIDENVVLDSVITGNSVSFDPNGFAYKKYVSDSESCDLMYYNGENSKKLNVTD